MQVLLVIISAAVSAIHRDFTSHIYRYSAADMWNST